MPKYLNSPETPIYTKGRTLYGLDVTKGAVRKHNYCVLVEGYFDLAQVWQAGVQPVVASCGTALTTAQARTLKRFTSKVVLSFDPDAAGQGAAARSSELLVAEGFQVNVALLPEGSDPDTFIRRIGRAGLRRTADGVAAVSGLSARSRRRTPGLQPAGQPAGVPERDADGGRRHSRRRRARPVRRSAGAQGADHRSGHPRRDSKGGGPAQDARRRRWRCPRGAGCARPNRGCCGRWSTGRSRVWRRSRSSIRAIWRGWSRPRFCRLAASLADVPPDLLPRLLRERLSEGERALLERAARAEAPARRAGRLRERAASGCATSASARRVQEEIDRLQERSPAGDDRELAALWERKKALLKRLEDLNA